MSGILLISYLPFFFEKKSLLIFSHRLNINSKLSLLEHGSPSVDDVLDDREPGEPNSSLNLDLSNEFEFECTGLSLTGL